MLSVLLLFFVSLVFAEDTYVTLPDGGKLKGFTGPTPWEDVRSFLGVPFAKPPVGELRFKPTVAYGTYNGTIDATQYGDSCLQSPSELAGPRPLSEDCLFLNVWTPRKEKITKPLPVMLFFYGGGYSHGGADFQLYSGQHIINHGEKEVVVITANYRLLAFGYLGSKELQSQSPDGSTGNMGLQDQRMAMRWVAENIAAFGGDPSTITIWGESAGAGSVSNHLVAPRSKGHFHRAIMQSGPETHWIAHNLTASQTAYGMILKKTGCDQSQSAATQVKCLQAADAKTIMSVHYNPPGYYLRWAPVIDGVELPENPQLLARQGKFSNKVPVLLGSNHDEGTLLSRRFHNTVDETAAEFDQFLHDHYGGAVYQEMLQLYKLSNYKSPYWAFSAVVGDDAMTCPVQRTADWLQAAGAPPTYVYFYTHELDILKDVYPELGVFHGSELIMVWKIDFFWYDHIPVPLPLSPAEHTLGDHFISMWTNFAHGGNPNEGPSSVPYQWPAWSKETQKTLQIDETFNTLPFNRKPFCDFFDSIYNVTIY